MYSFKISFFLHPSSLKLLDYLIPLVPSQFAEAPLSSSIYGNFVLQNLE